MTTTASGLVPLEIPRKDRTPGDSFLFNIRQGPSALHIQSSMSLGTSVIFMLCGNDELGMVQLTFEGIVVEWKRRKNDWLEIHPDAWENPRNWTKGTHTICHQNLTVIPIKILMSNNVRAQQLVNRVFDIEWSTQVHQGLAWCAKQ